MPTIWVPEQEEDDRAWVLDNHKVVEAPKMEISSAGRRVRLQDQPETSVWLKDRDKVIEEAIEQVAQREQTSIMTCTTASKAHFAEEGVLPVPRIRHDDQNRLTLKLVWIFRHPDAPLYARLTVTIQKQYYNQNPYEVTPVLTFDEMSARARHASHTGEARDETWFVGGKERYWSDEEERKRAQLQQAAITPKLKKRRCRNERSALQAVRELMEIFDSQLHVQIPDVRTEKVRWISYEFLRTNVDGEFVADLNTYLDSEATILQVYEAYQTLREGMRRLGVPFPARAEDDFARALSTPDDQALTIELTAESTMGERAGDHEVTLHLASGTITVACDHTIDHKSVAAEWNLAHFEAEMRDELEAFLSFQKTARERRRQQVIDIVQERTGQSQP